MNSRCSRPAAMISRAIALASAMSEPTSRPSQRSAHSADDVRRGSTVIRRAPRCTPFRRWWKKIGCVSRALLPHRRTTSVSSISRYELVPPPAPNTIARPATEGACQVRLQLSMLLLPRTVRENFWAAKLTSLVDLLQLKSPNVLEPCAAPAARSPAAARSSASSQVAGRRMPVRRSPSRTSGVVRRTYSFGTGVPRWRGPMGASLGPFATGRRAVGADRERHPRGSTLRGVSTAAPSTRQGMGAIPHDGGTTFRVWAPHAVAVFVTGTFDGWAMDATPLAPDGDHTTGTWSADVE